MKSIGEGVLNYTAQTGSDTEYYNLARDLSFLNARNEEVTDRDGHLYGYWAKVRTLSAAEDVLAISQIPNTWKVRNSFRKFHFARNQMFKDAGVTKKEMGKYGRTLRPYFSPDHLTNGSLDPQIWMVGSGELEPAGLQGGEWTYTTLASSPTVTADIEWDSIDEIAPVDDWTLTVLGVHQAEATSAAGVKTWDSVGMVMAYNTDRMEQVPDATEHTSVTGFNNPLASLATQTLTSGEIVDIAEDQQLEEPPYSVKDTGDSTNAVYHLMPVAAGGDNTAAMRNWGLFFFPAGLISLTHNFSASSALEIEVIGKELCKDVA